MLKTVQRLANAYDKCLKKHPMKVQSCQAAFLMGTGDAISQTFIEKNEFYDVQRTVKFTTIGLALGPSLMLWYRTLDHIVGNKPYAIIKKVALDQIVAAPSLLFLVTSLVSLTDGKSIAETKSKLEKDYFEILLSNYKVWPLVQTINFSIVPLDYRVLVTQTVAIFWNTYLAYKTH